MPAAWTTDDGASGTKWDAAMRWLGRYHDYEVISADNLPRTGGVLVASTHSLATYENFLLGAFSRAVLGRKAWIVGDDLMFRIPGLAPTLREVGLMPRSRDTVIEMLRA